MYLISDIQESITKGGTRSPPLIYYGYILSCFSLVLYPNIYTFSFGGEHGAS